MSTQTKDPPAMNAGPFGLEALTRRFVQLALSERYFLLLLSFGFLLVGATFENAGVARWIGFMLAGYSAVANDSIQTIGTFIASNEKQKWWVLWLFIGGLFLATATVGWLNFGGDVSFGRLTTKGFDQAPQSFGFLQVAAPLFLMVLTRLRMPVSTTFLLLSSFATKPSGIGKVMVKSLSGYVVAFACAFAVWVVFSKIMEERFKGEAHPAWRVFQWISSGALWCVWIAHDAANVAVYLPRSLSLVEFLAFSGTIFAGLGVLFYMRGEGVQELVNEKSGVVDVRAATVIDFVYGVVLFAFTVVNPVPMSTTWVFLGLLGGRELAMALRGTSDRSAGFALKLCLKDVSLAGVGLIVSLVIAMAVNDGVFQLVMEGVGLAN